VGVAGPRRAEGWLCSASCSGLPLGAIGWPDLLSSRWEGIPAGGILHECCRCRQQCGQRQCQGVPLIAGAAAGGGGGGTGSWCGSGAAGVHHRGSPAQWWLASAAVSSSITAEGMQVGCPLVLPAGLAAV
jgi:hypothetical protein